MTIELGTDLLFDIRDDQWPIIYHKKYNVSFWGMEKLHTFDSKKWGKIIQILKEKKLINDDSLVVPNEAQKNDLLMVHSERYLKKLKWPCNVARIAEVPCLALCPNFIVQSHYLKPMRLQTGGTVLAGKLALERGWCINVGGGFHHCSAEEGAGFCPYADITLLVQFLREYHLANKYMILDLDAHQGNGYERDFLDMPSDVYIMDMYNKDVYPRDNVAKRAIRRRIELKSKCEDLEYMLKLRNNLREAVQEFRPEILIYNAGTDILDGDKLGRMYISEYAIIKRDEFVFEICAQNKIPIVMLTSGGYKKVTGRIIADSILNLHKKGLIGNPDLKSSTTLSFSA